MVSSIENDRLVLRRVSRTCVWSIPVKDAIQIKRRMECGMPYWQASPMHWLDRDAAALILNTPWKELACANHHTRR